MRTQMLWGVVLSGCAFCSQAQEDGSRATAALIHECTVRGADGFAASPDRRIDLHVASRDGSDAPMIQAHAIDTKGTGASGRAAVDHAINTKGTGTAGRAAVDPAINTKGTGAAGRASVDHAINTKGTGAAGRAARVETRQLVVDCTTAPAGDDAAVRQAARHSRRPTATAP
jgi:hypothetical protein